MILVTGAAGFIGYHACERLLREGYAVHGIDVVNDAYDPALKEARLARLLAGSAATKAAGVKVSGAGAFTFDRVDIADAGALEGVFARVRPRAVLHLAARAGVRQSAENPRAYAASNLDGFLNVLEGCRRTGTGHLVYGSSSSVYGLGTRLPFAVQGGTDHPVSFYAATKKANEVMAHSYAHLFGLPATGVRLFTVYGPWGRPDMALFTFTRAILEGRTLEVTDGGRMRRDFTYVDDAVEALVRLLARPAAADPAWRGDDPDPSRSSAPHRLYNVGNRSPVEVLRLIALLEECLGRKAVVRWVASGGCEVPASVADTGDLERDIGFAPSVPIEEGVRRFVAWYREFYRV